MDDNSMIKESMNETMHSHTNYHNNNDDLQQFSKINDPYNQYSNIKLAD